jgi:hypothetical protein
MVVAHEILTSADVRRQRCGARAGLASQTGNPRPEGRRDAFDGMGVPRLLRHGLGPLRRHHPGGGVIGRRVARGRFLVHPWQLRPPRLGPGATPLTHGTCPHRAGGGVHGAPEPRLVGPRRHDTPQRLGVGFQPSTHHGRGTRWNPDLAGIGTGGTASHPTGPQPRQPDPHGAAEAAEREALTPSVCTPGARRIRQEAGFGCGHTLPGARLPLMRLLPLAGRAICLVPAGSPRCACRSHEPGCCWSPGCGGCF